MESSVHDIVRRLLQEYTFEVETQCENDDILCDLCSKIMCDTYQSSCGCTYCYKCITDYLDLGNRFFNGNKEYCSNEALELEINLLRNATLNKKIATVKVICPIESCTYVSDLLNMNDHLRVCTKQLIECPYVSIGCYGRLLTNDAMYTHLRTAMMPHSQMLIEWMKHLQNELDSSKFEIIKMKNKERDVDAQIELLKQDSRIKEKFNDAILFRIDKVERIIDTLNNRTNTIFEIGRTQFTIDRFESRKTVKECILTPYFYSHANGYKIRLLVYPGGFGNGCGTHLCVCFKICMGEYDDLLPWPCQCFFHIAIINQRNRDTHKTETLNYDLAPDNCKDCYDKPMNGDNIGHGSDIFMSHSNLRSVDGLIVNDCVIIKCTVSAPT